ncbi:hypothetical protein ACFV24_03620 [Nocardia fluminea]|uniref:hypothetical protein n=1 Tax=Nocardia fluminea TaxID=134984 RepID=UPI00366F8585
MPTVVAVDSVQPDPGSSPPSQWQVVVCVVAAVAVGGGALAVDAGYVATVTLSLATADFLRRLLQ